MKILILLLIVIYSATSWGAETVPISPFKRPSRKVPTEAGPRPDTPRPAAPNPDTSPPKISPYIDLPPWVLRSKE